jgi:hypothetical protein
VVNYFDGVGLFSREGECGRRHRGSGGKKARVSRKERIKEERNGSR